MKSRETLIRLKRFQVDEKRRKVTQIEVMISEFERIASDLDREIKAEQDAARHSASRRRRHCCRMGAAVHVFLDPIVIPALIWAWVAARVSTA
jgi:hypothetical protein